MVATGTCCHGFRCKFIHDPRILMRPVKLRKQIEAFMIKRVAYYNENLRNKINKFDSNAAKDIFFWPAMGGDKDVQESSYNPQWSSNTRYYEPGSGLDGSYERQISMWNHFVCTCGCAELKENDMSSTASSSTSVSKLSNGADHRLPFFSQLTGGELPFAASPTSISLQQ